MRKRPHHIKTLPCKSVDWFLCDTSYYRKAFPNRRYVNIKINLKNQKLTCGNKRSYIPNKTTAVVVLLKIQETPCRHMAVERLNY